MIKFSALQIEDSRTVHHPNVDAIAIENIAAHDRPPNEAVATKLRLLAPDSETIRAARRTFCGHPAGIAPGVRHIFSLVRVRPRNHSLLILS
jgi:hypothetical protein